MARTSGKASTVKQPNPSLKVSASSRLFNNGSDFNDWPRSWMISGRDLLPGEQLLGCFRPFIEHLASSNLAPKTICRHINNHWLLGGRIITDLNETPSLRRRPIPQLLFQAIDDDEGGPLIKGGLDEPQQRSFDATCRKFRQFLKATK
jgi:hypothetical protein